MKKAIITLSLICAGLLATSNIGDLVFAQDTTKNINKTNNVEVQVINKLNKEKEIIIPISDKSELLSNVKSMILDNKLDSSWVELLVDIDELRSNMQKYSAEFDIYSEFDKLEDDLEECLNQFCKYTSEDLYECLINEKGFNFIENVGLVKR